MAIYYGRFKHGGKWSSSWHKIVASNKNEALGKFIKGTYYKPSEVQIKTTKPKGW